jgi:hypothetical protein
MLFFSILYQLTVRLASDEIFPTLLLATSPYLAASDASQLTTSSVTVSFSNVVSILLAVRLQSSSTLGPRDFRSGFTDLQCRRKFGRFRNEYRLVSEWFDDGRPIASYKQIHRLTNYCRTPKPCRLR